MELDALIFAAHPDDAEIGVGGTIKKLSADGLKTGVIDFTKGEMGTRGTESERELEASVSTKILGLTVRENFGLPDSHLKVNEKAINLAVEIIRKYKPTLIFAPFSNDRHPDHIAVSNIIKQAYFFSGVNKFSTGSEGNGFSAFRPDRLLYYFQAYTFEPNIIIDISETFAEKMEAIKAFKSQFYNPESNEPETFISKPDFLEFIEARAKFFGAKIGTKYGEPFYTEEMVKFNIINYLRNNF